MGTRGEHANKKNYTLLLRHHVNSAFGELRWRRRRFRANRTTQRRTNAHAGAVEFARTQPFTGAFRYAYIHPERDSRAPTRYSGTAARRNQ
jgi:UDP-galactopyranose mutase